VAVATVEIAFPQHQGKNYTKKTKNKIHKTKQKNKVKTIHHI
jgi:hypothetical protein